MLRAAPDLVVVVAAESAIREAGKRTTLVLPNI
jgi:hypothetical protein